MGEVELEFGAMELEIHGLIHEGGEVYHPHIVTKGPNENIRARRSSRMAGSSPSPYFAPRSSPRRGPYRLDG